MSVAGNLNTYWMFGGITEFCIFKHHSRIVHVIYTESLCFRNATWNILDNVCILFPNNME